MQDVEDIHHAKMLLLIYCALILTQILSNFTLEQEYEQQLSQKDAELAELRAHLSDAMDQVAQHEERTSRLAHDVCAL